MRARRIETDGLAEIGYSVGTPCYGDDVRAALDAIEADWAAEFPRTPHRVLVDVTMDKSSGRRVLIFNAREM